MIQFSSVCKMVMTYIEENSDNENEKMHMIMTIWWWLNDNAKMLMILTIRHAVSGSLDGKLIVWDCWTGNKIQVSGRFRLLSAVLGYWEHCQVIEYLYIFWYWVHCQGIDYMVRVLSTYATQSDYWVYFQVIEYIFRLLINALLRVLLSPLSGF